VDSYLSAMKQLDNFLDAKHLKIPAEWFRLPLHVVNRLFVFRAGLELKGSSRLRAGE
jgi:hypothetical protein